MDVLGSPSPIVLVVPVDFMEHWTWMSGADRPTLSFHCQQSWILGVYFPSKNRPEKRLSCQNILLFGTLLRVKNLPEAGMLEFKQKAWWKRPLSRLVVPTGRTQTKGTPTAPGSQSQAHPQDQSFNSCRSRPICFRHEEHSAGRNFSSPEPYRVERLSIGGSWISYGGGLQKTDLKKKKKKSLPDPFPPPTTPPPPPSFPPPPPPPSLPPTRTPSESSTGWRRMITDGLRMITGTLHPFGSVR